MSTIGRWWSESSVAARIVVVVTVLAAVELVVLGGGLLFGGGGGDGGDGDAVVVATAPAATATVGPATPTATATVTGTATATSTATAPAGTSTPEATATATAAATAEPTPDGPPTVRTLTELAEGYGDAPNTSLGRFRIPALGVDAPLGARVVSTADGKMSNPSGPGDVVWYDFSDWTGFGGAPGEGRNAIFSGHVDYAAYVWYAGVNYRGRGIFFDLRLLSPGDVIEVEMNGETVRYAVEWRQQIAASGDGWGDILSDDVERESITLITCGGDFNYATRQYADRTVVRATRL